MSSVLPTRMISPITVSVVIPTYNRGYVVHDAIESALAQTYRDFEILVVDDGSADNTRSIVESFKSDRIRYLHHDRNRGCSAAYNTGIKEARGSAVAFLDSDDRWKPDYLECQTGFLTRHPEVDVVFCDTEIHDPSGRACSLMQLLRVFPDIIKKDAGVSDQVISGRQMYLCLLEEVPVKPTAAIIKRQMFDRVGLFDEAWPSGTDWDLFLRLSRVAAFGFVNRVLAVQQRTPDATHQKFIEKDKLFLINLFSRERAALHSDPEALERVNRGLSGLYNSLAWNYLELGRHGDAISTYYRGFRETLQPKLLRKLASAIVHIARRDVARVLPVQEFNHTPPPPRQRGMQAGSGEMAPFARRPKVSVVMPAYNRGYIIREALESALNQTYADFEIVVVDDGSSDDTHDVVKSIDDDRIRYIRHERNRGYSAACNTGIFAATGEFIAFLDSDDLWKPDKTERQVAFLDRHSDVGAVFTDVEITGGETIPSLIALMERFREILRRKGRVGEQVLGGREIYLCLLEEVPIKPTALMVKREMFANAGVFDESWPSGTDWDLFLRLSHSCAFGYIDQSLAIQRRTPDATHLKFREKDKRFLLNIFLKERAKLKNDPQARAAVTRGISSHCNDLGWDYLHAGQKGKSILAYLQGFKETGESMMLVRAVSALMPLSLREAFRTTFKKSEAS